MSMADEDETPSVIYSGIYFASSSPSEKEDNSIILQLHKNYYLIINKAVQSLQMINEGQLPRIIGSNFMKISKIKKK